MSYLDIEVDIDGRPGYGGIDSDEIPYYFKSDEPSPCAECPKLYDDKDGCVDTCGRLVAWQIVDTEVTGDKMVEEVIKTGVGRRCELCGGKLVWDKKVYYCEDCLDVVIRVKTLAKAVKILLFEGWRYHEIKDLLGIADDRFNSLMNQLGYGPEKKFLTEVEKRKVVAYALKHGRKSAAETWGVHIQTVGRYVKKYGTTEKDRYKRLQERSKELLLNGYSIRQIADKIGVKHSTVWRWKKKMGI